jgi:hypothetical protein
VTGRLANAIESHLGSRDVARVIYGAIIGLALVVALETHPPAAGEVAVAVLATAVAVGLAEVYAAYVGTEAQTRRPVRRDHVRELATDAAAVSFGAGFPALFFVLAAAGAIETSLAFTLSKWTGLTLICAYGFLAARLAGAGIRAALLHAAAVGAIGGVLVTFKSLVH